MKFCLIVGVFLGILLGVFGTNLYLCIKNKQTFSKISKIIDGITFATQRLWYVVILTLSTVYVVDKYPDCAKFKLFSEFNGENLAFVLYLVLLILPLFDKLEVFGVNLGLRWENGIAAQAAKDASDTRNILNQEDLQRLNSKKEEGGNE